MRNVDIAIVGGGLAGSLAAAMLGRAGYDAVLIDPHTAYPADFRCEKLDGPQVRMLAKTGLLEPVLRAATYDREAWVARFGRLLDKRPSDQQGILYDKLVNTMRAEIPARVPLVQGKAAGIATSADRQLVTLADREEISARLVILANGLNTGLRYALKMGRRDVSPCHSVTIGFDIKPEGGAAFDFSALTYYPEGPGYRMAYLTLFPIGASMRANFIVYRDMNDPWLSELRRDPEARLLDAMPRLKKVIGAFEVVGPVKIRPADLYQTENYLRAGIVLVGDAFATSCPGAGTGTGKVFTDVERLCNVYIPQWLATDGMGEAKIAAFYADPVKQQMDLHSIRTAFDLRAQSIDTSLPWRLRRLAKFCVHFARGWTRPLRTPLSSGTAALTERQSRASLREPA